MKFVSTYSKITVLARDVTKDMYGRKIGDIMGLKAEFKGKERIFDSEATAKEKRWTEDQRLEVERYLLSHEDFGRMKTQDGGGDLDRQIGNVLVPVLYLARGQAIPDEHAEFVTEQKWWQILNASVPTADPETPTGDCQYVEADPEEPTQVKACPKKARKGQMYCQQHLAVAATA